MPKNVMCKNCNNLKHHWCKAVLDSPDEDMLRDCRHFRQKTNADRIRAMSDEELAEWLCDNRYCIEPKECPGYTACRDGGGKANGLKKWLKQPAEVDNE